jgi:hypothetical protein
VGFQRLVIKSFQEESSKSVESSRNGNNKVDSLGSKEGNKDGVVLNRMMEN